MNIENSEQDAQLQSFLNQEHSFVFSAGECNFVIQLLAHLVQENPEMVNGPNGEVEALNYQSIRTIVIARPTSAIVLYSQMIGRGMRGALVGGEESCRLVDIRDNFINFGEVSDVYTYFSDFWNDH